MKRIVYSLIVLIIVGAAIFLPSAVSAGVAFVGRIDAGDTVASAYPANGDLNAHGIAIIPETVADLVKGNILVSHFNNSDNLPGTGTTIIQISPSGDTQMFAQINPNTLPGKCEGGVGLTGLVVTKSGWVIAGSLPTKDGKLETAQSGCLIVLNSQGKVVETITDKLINGPWNLALAEGNIYSTLFVSNVLNGAAAIGPMAVNEGNVVRINLSTIEGRMPTVTSRAVVASGFGVQSDPKGFILGPTGLAVATNSTLYITDTLANRVAAVPDAVHRLTSAGRGMTVSQGGEIRTPLGLALTPNGHILIVNGGEGYLVEITPYGSQIAAKTIDISGLPDHTLFGLAVSRDSVYFLNDGDDALNILH